MGLIEQTKLEKQRRGRAVSYYRTVADSFYVPFSVTPHASTETLSPTTFAHLQVILDKSIAQAWMREAGEPRALGVHVFRSGDGLISQNITTSPDVDEPFRFFGRLLAPEAPAVWDTWGTRKLSEVMH